MHSLGVALVVFVCTFGGALLGMTLSPRLPPHHHSHDSKHTVQLGMGLLATLTGLLLGLLVSTSKSAFDSTDTEVKEFSAKIVMLDHVLARYGPETGPIRAQLRHFVARKIDQLWSHRGPPQQERTSGDELEEALDRVNALAPASELQRALKAGALALAAELTQARWLFIEGNLGSRIPGPFLGIIIFWLTVLFTSFGVFAPRNVIVVAALVVCALSVATAIFLVLELSQPFGGIIELSSAPARAALANMGSHDST